MSDTAIPGGLVSDRHNLTYVVPGITQPTFVGPPVIVSYTANGVISPEPGIKMLNKTSALASTTLAAPNRAGDYIFLIAGTAFAHVVTATGLIQDGVTGGAKATLTFGAFVGSSIGLVGIASPSTGALTWAVTFKNVCVIT
jgi:hypothetical protein